MSTTFTTTRQADGSFYSRINYSKFFRNRDNEYGYATAHITLDELKMRLDYLKSLVKTSHEECVDELWYIIRGRLAENGRVDFAVNIEETRAVFVVDCAVSRIFEFDDDNCGICKNCEATYFLMK